MRLGAAVVAVASAAAGLWLALQHPLGGSAAAAIFILGIAAAGLVRRGWLLALPALLPVLGLAPWTGWLAFEELDLLVLAIAAAEYARLALRPRHVLPEQPGGADWSLLPTLVIVLAAGSFTVSALRGVLDAGGWSFDLFQGYREPLGSVRLLKPWAWALLLLPLWHLEERRDRAAACDALQTGIVAGLGLASLAAVWERVAFPGLLNFSADYRTSALFWEMHVGGAAFDGFLALTVPFAVHRLQAARTHSAFARALVVAALAGYACLTTFSRGVYLAVPVATAVVVWLTLRTRQAVAEGPASQPVRASGPAVAIVAFVAAAAWVFPSTGYRGMLALLGVAALLLRLAACAPAHRTRWLTGLLAAAIALAFTLVATALLPKGAYIAFVLVFVAGVLLSLRVSPSRGALWGLAVGLLGATGAVAWHVDPVAGVARTAPLLALLAVAATALAARSDAGSFLPRSLRVQAVLLGAMALAAGVIGVLGGGAYMGDRFRTSNEDLHGRLVHWREGLAMLHGSADWAFGIGLGRYPARYALEHAAVDAPGDYRRLADGAGTRLVLTGGRHVLGWGEFLRVSQRIEQPALPLTVRVRARSDQTVAFHVDICEKHLIYEGNCLYGESAIKPGAGWQNVPITLTGSGPTRGLAYAPHVIAFSMANATSGSRVEIAEVSVRDPDGRELLRNRDFDDGLAGWFASSDRNHMPWHLKNIVVHALFNQGLVGLFVLTLLLVAACWRTVAGGARDHPLAPPLAAGIIAFVLVGMFDSLIDVPRLAFLFFLLVMIAMTARPLAPSSKPHVSAGRSGVRRRSSRRPRA